MGLRVGIDLGTTFSAVAVIDPDTGRPAVIPTPLGSNVTPSVLSFSEDDDGETEIIFGEKAKELQGDGNPDTVAFFKRMMGDENYSVEILDDEYNAEDMSAVLLKCLKDDAELILGEEITDAVITVPAYFAHNERTATISAGQRAGLNVLSIINEPTAAAFAYGLTEKEETQTILIYDLGGGTFDVTAARIEKTNITILASDGNHELGGKDWDDAVARHLAMKFEEITGTDLTDDPETTAVLLVVAEQLKKELTESNKATWETEYDGRNVSLSITYREFREVTDFLTRSTRDVTERLLKSAKLTWADFDGVILVGGSTRMRMIHDFIREMSGKEPMGGVNVDEAVALGAAIRANINPDGTQIYKHGEQTVAIQGSKSYTDVTAHSLGLVAVSEDGEKFVNSIVIPKNTKIPAEYTKPYKIKTRTPEYGTNEIEIYLTQGEFGRVLDNNIINKSIIKGIEFVQPPESVVNITYKYDENGVIHISAVQTENEKILEILTESVPDDMSWTDESALSMKRRTTRPQSIEAIICVDLSGSMAGEPTKIAIEAVRGFADKLLSGDIPAKIGVLAFGDEIDILCTPESDYKIISDKINMLRYTNVGAGNNADPFDRARLIMAGADAQYIVILTDGVWNDPKRAIANSVSCRKSGIDVISLGFGDADKKFIEKMATVKELSDYTELSNLGASFARIAQVIGE
jgi:molecular chaperone DnaK (HSP70)